MPGASGCAEVRDLVAPRQDDRQRCVAAAAAAADELRAAAVAGHDPADDGNSLPDQGRLRGIARTAVVAGTATAVSNRVSRRQADRWAQQDAEVYPRLAPPPPPAAAAPVAPAPDRIGQLKGLGELRDSGVLTEAEFEAHKAKILNT